MRLVSFLVMLVVATFAQTGNAAGISFYMVAHQDDWQLFMNPNAYDDVQNPWNGKTVFIYVTAGDAGARTGNNNYYGARENGANDKSDQ